MFRKSPIKQTEEEQKEILENFRENEFDKDDEKAMIFAALKVFLPAIIGLIAVIVAVIFGVLFLWKA